MLTVRLLRTSLDNGRVCWRVCWRIRRSVCWGLCRRICRRICRCVRRRVSWCISRRICRRWRWVWRGSFSGWEAPAAVTVPVNTGRRYCCHAAVMRADCSAVNSHLRQLTATVRTSLHPGMLRRMLQVTDDRDGRLLWCTIGDVMSRLQRWHCEGSWH